MCTMRYHAYPSATRDWSRDVRRPERIALYSSSRIIVNYFDLDHRAILEVCPTSRNGRLASSFRRFGTTGYDRASLGRSLFYNRGREPMPSFCHPSAALSQRVQRVEQRAVAVQHARHRTWHRISLTFRGIRGIMVTRFFKNEGQQNQ